MKKFILMAVGLIIIMVAASTIDAGAQMRTFLSEYSSAIDTCTNTATVTLHIRNPGAGSETAVQVVIDELSGTTGGTVSLLGSLDGINYKALTVRDSTLALPTFTPADAAAAQSFIWRITGNPVPYYQLSYGCTGTMSATISGKMFSH